MRRQINTIWEIKDEAGRSFFTQEDISCEAVKFFNMAYSRDIGRQIEDILWGIELYPTMFDENQNDALYSEVTEYELLVTMKSFQKDKCPGPDGWSVDFFIHFFDLFKAEILNMAEESRINGYINHFITSTYIALIPKKTLSTSFSEYRPISLCNVLYKTISKIIAIRVRNVLSQHLSPE